MTHRIVTAGLALVVFALSAGAATFNIGFAKTDITPQKPMPMWGYGDRHALLSTGVLDPLQAKAVVIDVGDTKLAIVGLDLGRSPMYYMMDNIRKAVKASVGVDTVLMSGSHTHHGPVLELSHEEGKGAGTYDDALEYIDGLQPKLIAVIEEAAKNAKPGRIGWGSKEVRMNRNRQSKIEPKPTDPELNVIRFDDESGSPIAVLVNYNAHPTMLPGEVLKFSAEWPGQMMYAVEDAIGSNCMFMQGSAGDMSVSTTPETNTIETYGKAMSEHVVEVFNGITTAAPEKPSIQAKEQDFEFDQRINLTNPTIQALFRQAFFPELANRSLDEYRDGKMHPHLTTVVLNEDLALVGASGEFFCNHSLRLKERARIKTVFFGYCNGHNMYYPTIEAAAEGGYGADVTVSWVPLGAGEEMMNEALINIYTFLGGYKNPMGL